MHICVRYLQLNPSFTIDVSFKLYCLLQIGFLSFTQYFNKTQNCDGRKRTWAIYWVKSLSKITLVTLWSGTSGFTLGSSHPRVSSLTTTARGPCSTIQSWFPYKNNEKKVLPNWFWVLLKVFNCVVTKHFEIRWIQVLNLPGNPGSPFNPGGPGGPGGPMGPAPPTKVTIIHNI